MLKEAENRFVRYAWNQTKKWKIGETQKILFILFQNLILGLTNISQSEIGSQILTILTTLIVYSEKAHSLIAKAIKDGTTNGNYNI